MDEKEEVEKAVKRGGRTGSRRKRYTYDEKLRAVKLHVEEGFNGELVCAETGVSVSSLAKWMQRYREQGEMGLRGRRRPGRGVACRSGERQDPGAEAREPLVWGEADSRRPAPVVLPGGEPGDGPEDPPRGGPHERAGESPPEPGASALLRAGDAEPDVAEGHLHVSSWEASTRTRWRSWMTTRATW